MDVAEVRELLDYNWWANRQLLDATMRLPTADFTKSLGASFGTVKGTMVHIIDSEGVWLEWWQGKPRPRELSADDFEGAAAVAAAYLPIEAGQKAWLERLTDDDLRAPVQVKDRSYRLARLVTHLITHSMYHRGQVASLIRQLGHTPPNTGFRTGFLDTMRLFEAI